MKTEFFFARGQSSHSFDLLTLIVDASATMLSSDLPVQSRLGVATSRRRNVARDRSGGVSSPPRHVYLSLFLSLSFSLFHSFFFFIFFSRKSRLCFGVCVMTCTSKGIGNLVRLTWKRKIFVVYYQSWCRLVGDSANATAREANLCGYES